MYPNHGGTMSDNLNNAIKTSEVTDEQVSAFDLSPHLIRLMWDEPFFARILQVIEKTKTTSIPTAGVIAKDSKFHLYWNPRFLAGLHPKKVKGLLKHECYHLVFEHTTTRKNEPHIIWNYATDLAINSLIDESELPEGGLIPGKKFSALSEDQIKNMGQQAAERYNKISEKIASFPKMMSSEWYFAELMNDKEVQEAIKSSESMQGKSLEQALADGDVKIDENGNLVDQDGNPVTLVPGDANGNPMDSHDGWNENLSDEQRELLKGKMKKAIENAIKNCDGSNSWGSVPMGMQETLRKMMSKEIPWQSVLKQFVGMSKRSDRLSTIKRVNRKYPGIHPGIHKSYTASIAVYVDQSGSVSDSDLELLGGELDGLAEKVEFTLYNFDTEVDENSKRVIKKGKNLKLERTRCGGTDFKCVQEHANKNKSNFDGYLVLTDGYAPDPKGHNKLKRGWVIVPNGQLQFNKSSKDFIIKMKRDK